MKRSIALARYFSLEYIPFFPKEALPIVLPSGGSYLMQLPWLKIHFLRVAFIQKQATIFGQPDSSKEYKR